METHWEIPGNFNLSLCNPNIPLTVMEDMIGLTRGDYRGIAC